MKEISEFKVGDHWWSRDGMHLFFIEIVSESRMPIKCRCIYPPEKYDEGNRFSFYPKGTLFSRGKDNLDLIKKETDKRKILKTHLGLKETR